MSIENLAEFMQQVQQDPLAAAPNREAQREGLLLRELDLFRELTNEEASGVTGGHRSCNQSHLSSPLYLEYELFGVSSLFYLEYE